MVDNAIPDELKELNAEFTSSFHPSRRQDNLVTLALFPIRPTKLASLGEYAEEALLLYGLLERLRQLLAALPPLSVISLAFGRTTMELPILQAVTKALGEHRSREISWHPSQRTRLVFWVYRSRHLARHISNLRVPSRCKRAFLATVLSKAKRRNGGINSKVVHAWAFRPGYFAISENPKHRPLYAQVAIPKRGAGTRYLHIPIPRLARLQRTILREILDPAVGSLLHESVYGFRPGGEYTIFRAAQRHSGARFVASFDLKDFFHSTRMRHIIPALKKLTVRLGNPENPELVPWDQDTSLLVARLLTHRGRLPQGAPSSPAVANLAFAPFDARITKSLANTVVYTRYADDLTFSVTRRGAKKLGIDSAKEFLSWVQQRLETALEGSGYTLNAKKTRCATMDQGCRILGLRVTKGQVDLPRSMKRNLRLSMHQVRSRGLLETAKATPGLVGSGSVRAEETRRGLRHFEDGRRQILETEVRRLARFLCPNLNFADLRERVGEEASTQEAIPQDLIARRLDETLERLLSYLWTGRLRAQGTGPRTLMLLDQGGEPICQLAADRNIWLFAQPLEQVVQISRLVLRLRGYANFLGAAPDEPAFKSLAQWRQGLQNCLDQASLGDEPPVGLYTAEPSAHAPGKGHAESNVNLSQEDDVAEANRNALLYITGFRRQLGLSVHPSEREFAMLAPAKDRAAFERWVQAAHDLLLGTMVGVPHPRKGDIAEESAQVLDFLRLYADLAAGRRALKYRMVDEYLKSMRKEYPLSRQWELLQVQQGVLHDLRKLFSPGAEVEQTREPLPKENLWATALEERRVNAAREFAQLRERLTSTNQFTRLFKQQTSSMRDERARFFLDEIDRPFVSTTNQGVWYDLFEFGRKMTILTRESLEAEAFDAFIKRNRSILRPLELLRNRASHDWDPTELNRKDVDDLQKSFAKHLEVHFKFEAPANQGDLFQVLTMKPTSYEATELVVILLEGLVKSLRKAAQERQE